MSRAMDDKQVLKVRNLTVRFYTYAGVVHAVTDAYIDIYEGESIAIVGETGCGKTIFTRAITGLIEPPGKIESGTALFRRRGGEVIDLLKLGREALRQIRGDEISYVFQDPSSALDPLYTAGYHITETLREHYSIDKSEANSKAIELLRNVLIPNPELRVKNYPHELSGGMRQRIVIAAAIANQPRLLIADEPTTNLDVTVQAQILELIESLKEKYGMGLILITHNLGIVAEIAERVYIMYGGMVVENGDVFSIFEAPQHPYTKLLLRSVPNPLIKVEKLESIPGTVPDLIDMKPGCPFAPRCPQALPVCSEKTPPQVNLGKGHVVHCWLLEKGGASE
ncbi:MAG: ABC transporter ATP-binding protein [Thermofilaceae archaeon]